MSGIMDGDLLHGLVPVVLTVAGALAGATLLARRNHRWWTRTVPLVAAVSVTAGLLIWWVVDDVWQPFPDALPFEVMAWIGAALFAIGLAAATVPAGRWRRRTAAVAAAVLVMITAAAQINVYYGQFPNLRAAFGMPSGNEIDPGQALASSSSFFRAQPGRPLAESWRPPADMPRQGAVTQVAIPPEKSAFTKARNAYLYLPPAYRIPGRPLLPVLVLVHGQPGSPSDWTTSGRLASTMDSYAQAHNGLAPVVVMPDATGTTLGNPLCLDSRLGASETYLTTDVPDWIRHHLQIDPDTRHWAVAGSSYGGTCALQLALRKPKLSRQCRHDHRRRRRPDVSAPATPGVRRGQSLDWLTHRMGLTASRKPGLGAGRQGARGCPFLAEPGQPLLRNPYRANRSPETSAVAGWQFRKSR